jgi:PilZ domain
VDQILMYLGVERRINPRHRITTAGVIWLERNSMVECTVRDFSPAGAGLVLPEGAVLPAEFDLTFDDATRHCVTVWRRRDRMGVKLKSIAAVS